MRKIIIIEDDTQLGTLVKTYLEKSDYTVDHFELPIDGLLAISKNDYDLLVLDVMLPQMDGFGVLKKLREESTLPVLMLTARGDIDDRIQGLDLGADDYLPKPFDPRELLARIDSIMRRSGNEKTVVEKVSVYRCKDLEVNFDRREAFLEGHNLEMTTMEFELLAVFIRLKGKALSRDDIMNELQGIDSNVFSRSIDILVSRLRQKLKDKKKKDAQYIKTIWGKGYMFIGEDG